MDRRAWLCSPVERLSTEAVRQANLDLVVDLLEQHCVDYFLLSPDSHLRHTVGVSARDRGQVLAALTADLTDSPAYVSLPRARGRHDKARLVADVRLGRLAQAQVLRLGRVVASHCGRLVLGMDHGCELEFWSEDESGTLTAPRPNRRTAEIAAPYRRRASTVVRDREYRTLEPFARGTMQDVCFPVDVVYTWVDGQDPHWRAKKDDHLRRVGRAPLNGEAANSARYLSRDELRYSLRSLEMYADWVRTVHLVTDDQVPAWLDTTNPRLHLVSHREIFDDPRCLPTFNSHAIESRLHHIPGLADHYLYLNDDFFFGRPVPPELFFVGNGTCRFFLSNAQLDLGPAEVADPPVMSAAKNNRALIERMFGTTVTQKLKHVPHSQRRDVLLEMEDRFREDFTKTGRSRFRSVDNISIPSALHAHYAYCTGRAVPGEIRYLYTDLADPLTWSRLEHLLRRRDLDVFCLNDTDDSALDAEAQSQALHAFLSAYFPVASSFERRDVPLARLRSSPARVSGERETAPLVQSRKADR